MSYTVPCSACEEKLPHDSTHCRIHPKSLSVPDTETIEYSTYWLCTDCGAKFCNDLMGELWQKRWDGCADCQDELPKIHFKIDCELRNMGNHDGCFIYRFCRVCWGKLRDELTAIEQTIPHKTHLGCTLDYTSK
jgi:hypothetical protein